MVTIVAMVASMWLLAVAVRTLPLGTAYAVWTGIGTVGTALVGIALFGEPATFVRLACIGMILAGIIGLKRGARDRLRELDQIGDLHRLVLDQLLRAAMPVRHDIAPARESGSCRCAGASTF